MGSKDQNPLPGVPSIESPFFHEIFNADSVEPTTLRIARDLHEEGFAVFDFPEPDLDILADRIRTELAPQYDWRSWLDGSRPDLRLQDAWQNNSAVEQLAVNASVAALLEQLYGRASFPFQTLNFAVGTQQHLHTDSLHFSANPERFMCGVWIALEDIGPDQGPLVYYPGSHKWPIFTNEHIEHAYVAGKAVGNYEYLWERLVKLHGVKPIQFLPRKGQAAIWAANLLHGGAAQNDKSLTRWSQVNHYYFENCSYYTPFFSDIFYGSILYREPFDIKRKAPVNNIYNGFSVPLQQIERTAPDKFVNLALPVPEDFDAATYLDLHPDVRAAGGDPALHYYYFGRKEGRRYKHD